MIMQLNEKYVQFLLNALGNIRFLVIGKTCNLLLQWQH